jgi:hypothetical protein
MNVFGPGFHLFGNYEGKGRDLFKVFHHHPIVKVKGQPVFEVPDPLRPGVIHIGEKIPDPLSVQEK